MIVIDRHTVVRFGCRKMFRSFAKTDRRRRANAGTGGFIASAPPVGTQIALHRVMINRSETHRAVGTSRHAFATASATALIDRNHARHRILMNRLWIARESGLIIYRIYGLGMAYIE